VESGDAAGRDAEEAIFRGELKWVRCENLERFQEVIFHAARRSVEAGLEREDVVEGFATGRRQGGLEFFFFPEFGAGSCNQVLARSDDLTPIINGVCCGDAARLECEAAGQEDRKEKSGESHRPCLHGLRGV
jgi:hypothetical protein